MDASVALVHDYLLVRRGAERTFLEMATLWPEAPVHTLLYDEAGIGEDLHGRDVRTSYLQRLPWRQGGFRRLLPLCAHATGTLDLEPYDLVVSSSSAFAHGVQTREDAVHVCYCYTPFRYAWFEEARALAEVPSPLRPLLRRTLRASRRWDLDAAQRVSRYVAISELSRERIARYLGRDAEIVHPPVALDRFAPTEGEDFFLVVSELVRHKQIGLALEAAHSAGQRIKVVGSGPDTERLAAAYPQAEFLGRISDAELADLYPRCRALVVPNVEEFGIAAVEVQASGRPVLAIDGGGARETVLEQATGVFVPRGDASRMAAAMTGTDWDGFAREDLLANAERFSAGRFHERMLEQVDRAWTEAKCPGGASERPRRPSVARPSGRFQGTASAGSPQPLIEGDRGA